MVNLRYGNGQWDQESGLILMWHRYCDPRPGRFISFDPIGVVRRVGAAHLPALSPELKRQLSIPWPQEAIQWGLNQPYAYVRSNPLRWKDPTGLYDDGFPGMGGDPIETWIEQRNNLTRKPARCCTLKFYTCMGDITGPAAASCSICVLTRRQNKQACERVRSKEHRGRRLLRTTLCR